MRSIPCLLLACLLVSLFPTAGGATTDPAELGSGEPTAVSAPARLGWEVVERRPHDSSAYTQGLELGPDGRLYESTGRYGASSLREVDPETGGVIRSVELADELFGEGLTRVGDRLVQLTWTNGLARVYDRATFELAETFTYAGQGWGLCFDGHRLVMSDGSDQLTFRDHETFEVLGRVDVRRDGEPVSRLNELECVDDVVWANVWWSDEIMRIDPTTGEVTGVLDLDGVLEPHPIESDSVAVLNGIAWDASSETFLVTGKHWPELIEISLTD